jgi:hypothetical protein
VQNVYAFWVTVVFGAHMLCVLLLQRFLPVKASHRAWAKLKAVCTIELVAGLRLKVPTFDDTKLLVACLLWPPACFVSDATDAQGMMISRLPEVLSWNTKTTKSEAWDSLLSAA